MNHNAVERLTDGIFSKALQVRRMLQRDCRAGSPNPANNPCSAGLLTCERYGGEATDDLMPLVLAEIAALSRRVEELLEPETLTEGASSVAGQRWHRPTVEMSVAEGYSEWAQQYDNEANPLIALEESVVLELAGEVTGLDILDAACGTGRYALRFAAQGARVYGLDGCEAMLTRAREKAAAQGITCAFMRGDLNALPYADESFDLMVCALAFCHLPCLKPAIREAWRVLRPGGRLIISDFHPFCLLVGWRTAFDRPEARYWIENHLNLTQDYVKALLTQGFSLIDLRESVVDERVAGLLSLHDIERFRGWPAALVLEGRKG